jgi:hypothetical protein
MFLMLGYRYLSTALIVRLSDILTVRGIKQAKASFVNSSKTYNFIANGYGMVWYNLGQSFPTSALRPLGAGGVSRTVFL